VYLKHLHQIRIVSECLCIFRRIVVPRAYLILTNFIVKTHTQTRFKLTIFNGNQCWKVATLITYLVELHWTSFKIYSILKIFIVCWIYVFCMLECSFHLSCDVIIAVCIILTTGMTGAISIQIFCVYYYHTWKE